MKRTAGKPKGKLRDGIPFPGALAAVVPPRTRSKVLMAAGAMVEDFGYSSVTIEGVALAAGVAKTTVYRWWPSKAELMLDLFDATTARQIVDPMGRSLKSDLEQYLEALRELAEDPLIAAAVSGLFVETQLDETTRTRMCARFGEFRRAGLDAILARAKARREVRDDIDAALVEDLIVGPFWYRVLVAHEPVGKAWCRRLVATALKGLAPSTI